MSNGRRFRRSRDRREEKRTEAGWSVVVAVVAAALVLAVAIGLLVR